jgi:hypothetical protein
MSELHLTSTSDPPTSFCCSEFPKTLKLAVTATATEIVKQSALYSKKILVVSATTFHQQRPSELSNP